MCNQCEMVGRSVHEVDGGDAGAVGSSPVALLASIPAGFETRLNVRFLPATDVFVGRVRAGCQPRAGAIPHHVVPVELPATLVERFRAVNDSVIAWLAKDEANAAHYLSNPVAALQSAGVQLSRAEAKALSRSHQAVRDQAVLPPGGQLSELVVSASVRGKVGEKRPDVPVLNANSPSPDCDC